MLMCKPEIIDEVTWGDIISRYNCEGCPCTNCEFWSEFNDKH